MQELLEAAFAGINVIPTGLLLFTLIYWLIVILGLVHVDTLDVDVPADVHADAHSALASDLHGTHSETAAHGTDSVSWFNHVLAFFNLGQIPLMVFLSFLALPMWAISILANHYSGNQSFWLALLLLIPNFIGSLFIAKFLTMPFVKVFSYLYKDPQQIEIIGKICTVLLSTSHDRLGQAIIDEKGTVLMLNVKTSEGVQLAKGQSALVVEFQEKQKCYLIAPFEV